MTVVNDADAFTKSAFGVKATKAYTPLVVETKTLFTVSGLVLVTSIVGQVTTAITVANTVKLQANPTVGATVDLCAATDIGTTDTPAGNLLTVAGAPATSIVNGVGAVPLMATAQAIAVAAGTIEQVTATGADGGITWYITYVPLASGATIVAA
ncbi:MAG: hypothetical protein ABWY81_10990 [Jiangellaceae bacterium]